MTWIKYKVNNKPVFVNLQKVRKIIAGDRMVVLSDGDVLARIPVKDPETVAEAIAEAIDKQYDLITVEDGGVELRRW